MKGSHLAAPVLVLAASLWALTGFALASTRGYDTTGNPLTGLQVTLVLLLAVIVFTLGYIFLNKFEQWRVNRMKENGDVDSLIKALRSPWFSSKAARALGEIGDERAVEPLIMALECRSAETREAVADALGNIGDARAMDRLNAALDDRYVNVREHARSSLEKIRNRMPAGSNGNASA